MIGRRTMLAGGAALIVGGARAALPSTLKQAIPALEREIGGRIGLAVLDTRSDSLYVWRGDERFPMCSTFKMLAVAAVLAKVDKGRERLDRAVPVREADRVDYAPFAATRIGGSATVGELCQAAITLSDNMAGNLLLGTLGGPKGVTAYARSLGDHMTRLDRTEPTLNTAIPGDPRDTTTPLAVLALMDRILLDRALSPAGRQQLVDWMVGCRTGDAKLRAGLPSGWRIAAKTGSGDHGTDNEVALLWPPAAKPLIVASYLTGSDRPPAQTAAIHARIARLVTAG